MKISKEDVPEALLPLAIGANKLRSGTMDAYFRLRGLRTRPNRSADLDGRDMWTNFHHEGDAPDSLRRFAESLNGRPFTKWDHYFDVYESVLGELARSSRAPSDGSQPLKILEIGVFRGGSLQLWREYFGASAVIYGVDIDPSCAELGVAEAEVRIGSQADESFLNSVVDEMGGVDVVVDDGSHVSKHVKRSLEILYPRLSANGVYIIEDLATSYWPEYGGGLRRSGSSVEMLKSLVDELNKPYFNARTSRASRIIGHHNLASIQFFNGMAVLRKGKQDLPRRASYGRNPQRKV